MFNFLISISFLGIILIPVLIFFLILVKNLGEELRNTSKKQNIPMSYKQKTAEGQKSTPKLRRVK